MSKKEIVLEIRRLAIAAGERIMEVYNGPEFDVQLKSDDSPVTIADETADKFIFEGLSGKFPEIPIVTEEQSHSHEIKADKFFIVDPLDGTKEFIHRRGDFTVNIALIENGVPTLGVVYAPAKDRLFYVDENGNSVEEQGKINPTTPQSVRQISVKPADNTQLTVVASKSHRDQATDDYIAKYAVSEFQSAGSSLKFCLVATGEADLYPRLGRTMEWDTAAGHAVLLGANGAVVRFDTHAPLTYGKDGYENPFFIAHSPAVALKA